MWLMQDGKGLHLVIQLCSVNTVISFEDLIIITLMRCVGEQISDYRYASVALKVLKAEV